MSEKEKCNKNKICYPLQELNLTEIPTMMTILDSSWSSDSPTQSGILVCVGYKDHWNIVNGSTGFIQHLHTIEGAKVHLLAALDLYEDQEIQFLLCYNRKFSVNQYST